MGGTSPHSVTSTYAFGVLFECLKPMSYKTTKMLLKRVMSDPGLTALEKLQALRDCESAQWPNGSIRRLKPTREAYIKLMKASVAAGLAPNALLTDEEYLIATSTPFENEKRKAQELIARYMERP